jgi:hypothetical protein
MENTEYRMAIGDVIMDAVKITKHTPASFARAAGFENTQKMYHIVNGRNEPGLKTLQAILKEFPQLNGDRFIRLTGPILLRELNPELVLNSTGIVSNTEELKKESLVSDSVWKQLAEERSQTIKRQEREIEFLREMIMKK